MDGSYGPGEIVDLPEILARQWAASGYCRVMVVPAAPAPAAANEPATPAPAARQQRFKPLRNRTPDADLL